MRQLDDANRPDVVFTSHYTVGIQMVYSGTYHVVPHKLMGQISLLSCHWVPQNRIIWGSFIPGIQKIWFLEQGASFFCSAPLL
jgi:hypothetical protein